MKKKGAAYGLLDGWIYPFSSCFFRNSFNATCSGCIREYTFPGRELGALGFKSIVWFQERFLGIVGLFVRKILSGVAGILWEGGSFLVWGCLRFVLWLSIVSHAPLLLIVR